MICSRHWAIQPGSRPIANSTVNIRVGNPHRLVDDAGVEVDVRVEAPLDEVVVGERDLLELLRDVEERVLHAEVGEDLVGGGLHERRARVEVLVDPVAEAHELDAVLLALHALDELLDRLAGVADLGEHVEDGLVRAAMERTVDVDPRGDAREDVRLGRPDQSHGRGGRVLLMVLVEDEQTVERAHEHGVDLVHLGEVAEVELQEVLDEAQRIVRVQERLADRLLVRVRREDRQLREEADGVELDLLRSFGSRSSS